MLIYNYFLLAFNQNYTPPHPFLIRPHLRPSVDRSSQRATGYGYNIHMQPRHLYIHIPFCQRRCSYCDFNTYANMEDRIEAYVAALCDELRWLGAGGWQLAAAGGAQSIIAPPLSHGIADTGYLTRAALRPTIFLGGGTPTVLSLSQMERVLMAANTVVSVADAEVTTEANPGTVIDQAYLRGLRTLGINRISFGVQSLHDPLLRVLGRIHTAGEAIETYHQARRAGFERINLDFMFGLPGQTLAQWRHTLDQLLVLDADHFSLYSLIVEEDTPLHQQVLKGLVAVPDDDLAGEMYELAMERLAVGGYTQYEISNWAKGAGEGVLPTQASHHNVAYWLNADWLAAGAGAHAHVQPRRWHDILNIDDYIRSMRDHGDALAETTLLSAADLHSETMIMGLRLNAGVGYAHFRDRCGVDMRTVYGPVLDELADVGLLVQDAGGVRLSERGRMLGNQVWLRFLDEAVAA